MRFPWLLQQIATILFHIAYDAWVLGAHKINVITSQVEDRIDDALKYWRDYHYAATEKSYFKHIITEEDKTNGYITVPDDILEVVRIIDAKTAFAGTTSFTNPMYQFMMNEMWTLTGRSLTPYFLMRMEIEHIREMLGNKIGFRFNRHSNRLYIDTNWDHIPVGQYLVCEAYYFLNPETVTEMWGDRWLQQYATALIKRQWGQNLSKYRGVRLLDGYEFDSTTILQEASAEIEKLETEVIDKYSLPPIGVIA